MEQEAYVLKLTLERGQERSCWSFIEYQSLQAARRIMRKPCWADKAVTPGRVWAGVCENYLICRQGKLCTHWSARQAMGKDSRQPSSWPCGPHTRTDHEGCTRGVKWHQTGLSYHFTLPYLQSQSPRILNRVQGGISNKNNSQSSHEVLPPKVGTLASGTFDHISYKVHWDLFILLFYLKGLIIWFIWNWILTCLHTLQKCNTKFWYIIGDVNIKGSSLIQSKEYFILLLHKQFYCVMFKNYSRVGYSWSYQTS